MKSDSVHLEVERGDDDDLRIDNDGSVLRIKRKKLYNIESYDKDEAIKVRISYTVLRRIKGSAGAEFYSKSPIEGDQLLIKLGSGAEGDLEVNLNKIEIYLGEGAQLEIEGQATDQESFVSTGAVLEGYRLKSENTYVKASTGGEAEVHATARLEANAHTGGDIKYKGDPDKVKVSDNLGGQVSNHR